VRWWGNGSLSDTRNNDASFRTLLIVVGIGQDLIVGTRIDISICLQR
jgi:hypothetical protein